ncbi:hypothetical protein [Capnocytophaga catalasegens]|uniref:Uncharacterized protein n=1 Tax=Capnocytophaga catalasegens TaxID=1004260 RepID=A0AAV5AY88_9FLAO|nr:hypothetical protein [Capnocytophaga catalasegens]GIZ16595.1 hypothetical protein RCZ03_25950 [Capnocytophaga catalasegens]GJM51609.1 hypothetical protein RCZ15_25820 [Capnocytophaga catalasegens]GJM54239.1 hypothetical protein RCZ16_25550 [Capnocytophaga catalasegens]
MNKLPQKGEFKYDKEPKVIEMYWSYGEENTILSNISKHYTDMDLIVNTRNYEVGESITITIKAEDNEPIAEGLNEITLTGIVNENNQVVFEHPLKEYSLCITNNIIKDKIEEENKIYKTYQGKNYTKEEWDVFEEQLYKEYLERKKKKFFKF